MGGSAGTVSAITRPTHRIRAHRRYPLPDLDRGQCLLASSNTIAAARGGHRAVSAIALLPRMRPARERALATGLARRPGASIGASRGPAAGKKLPRNPRLLDQQEGNLPSPPRHQESPQVSRSRARADERQRAASPQQQAPLLLTHTAGPEKHPPAPGLRRTTAPLAPHVSQHPPQAAGERVTCARFCMPAKRKQLSVTARRVMLLTSRPHQVARRLLASGSGKRSRPHECARPR